MISKTISYLFIWAAIASDHGWCQTPESSPLAEKQQSEHFQADTPTLEPPPEKEFHLFSPLLPNTIFYPFWAKESDGYLLGRIISPVRGSLKWISTFWHPFSAEVYLGELSSGGGLLDEACFEKKVEQLKERRSERAQRAEAEEYDDSHIGIEGNLANQNTIEAQAQRSCTRTINPWHVAAYSAKWLDDLETVDEPLYLIRYVT